VREIALTEFMRDLEEGLILWPPVVFKDRAYGLSIRGRANKDKPEIVYAILP